MKSAKLSRKIIAIALVACMAASGAVTASAISSSEAKEHTFGVTGAFEGCDIWCTDIPMTDIDGDGIYTVKITGQEPGEYEFKIRADGSWDYSWGEYEWQTYDGYDADRTFNSFTNCQVTVGSETDVITVALDTTKLSTAALAQDGSYSRDTTAYDDDAYLFWPVSYWLNGEPVNIEALSYAEEPVSPEEPFKPEEPSEEPSEEPEEPSEEPEKETGKYAAAYNVAKAQLGEDLSGYYFFDNSETKWATVGAYWWTPEENAPWPGQAATQIEGTDIWAVQYAPETDTIIFNNLVSDTEYTVENPKLLTKNIIVSSETNAGQIFVIDMATEDAPKKYQGAVKMYDGAWMTFNDDAPVVEPSEIEYPQYPDEDEEDVFEYSTNYDGTITIKGYNGNDTDVVIPSEIKGKTVTSIGDYAFDHSNIISITIPDTVVSIGESAFEFCTSLESITIPDSVVKVGNRAFYCTPWLNNQPYGLVYIGKVAYAYIDDEDIGNRYNKQSIVLKEGTVSISDNAFSDVYGLTDIIIPDSVTYIGNNAFENCYNLESITIPDGVTYIGDYAFKNCEIITSVTIPNSVTYIGSYVFDGCENLINVTIPKSVTYIGTGAFLFCLSLEKITVDADNAKYSSQDGVLFNKDKTKLLAYPKTKQGQYTVPDTVTSINSSAFADCTGLTGITIPDSVNYIGKYAFQYCPELTSVKLPENITQISYAAFDWCSNLKSINIPNSVKFIDDYAFSNCSSLTDIKLPDSLQYIGESAFLNCTGIKSLTVPDSVVYIGGNAIGYYMDYDYWEYVLIDDFTIYGTAGSKAESYAIDNSIKFISNLINNSTISSTEIKKGESVTLNAVATGGTSPYQYAYYYKKTSSKTWTTAKTWSDTTSVSIKPAAATTYDVCIKVKDSKGTVAKKYFTVNVTAPLANNSTVSKTTINKGDSLTLTGKATGGTAPYQYAYYYKKTSSKTWTTAKTWSDTTSVSIKPAAATTYDVCIKVKDSKGTVAKKYFTVNVTAPLANNSTISKTEINKGESITLTGKATGGTAPYQYEFTCKYSSSATWSTLKSYSTTSTRTWTPARTGTYQVSTKVKDANGTEVEKLFTLTVK